MVIVSAAGARLVLHDHGRVAGNVLGDVARQRARVDVVARADADADHDAHGLAFVEGGDVLLRLGALAAGGKQRGSATNCQCFHVLAPSLFTLIKRFVPNHMRRITSVRLSEMMPQCAGDMHDHQRREQGTTGILCVGEQYSAVRGFFRYYELIYTVSDERDVVRLRTNYRKGEETYLFHTRATPEHARATFLNYLKKINRIRNRPEWYNALTNNCTTNIATLAGEPQFDWRVVLNGHADQMLYERGDLATGNLPFTQLKEQAHINTAARAANDAPDFSRRIREGRPGF